MRSKAPSLLDVQLAALWRNLCTVDEIVHGFWPDAKLDWHQREIIKAILLGMNGQCAELAVKGCTGAGKGCSVAMACNIWYEAHPEAKVILHSASATHAKEVIFSEIVMWRRKMRHRCPDEIMSTSIKSSEKHYVIVANPDRGESFSGRHGGLILTIFDEASSSSEKYWNLAKTQADMRVAISNPRSCASWFYRLFPDKGRDDPVVDTKTPGGFLRRCVTVSGASCMNVRTGQKILEGQLTREMYLEIMANPEPGFREMFGEGRFPSEDVECQLILPSWLERHLALPVDNIEIKAAGLDIGDSDDGDVTILALGSEAGCRSLIRRDKGGTMETVSWTMSVFRDRYGIDLVNGQLPICVDADGIGKGVADRLAELGAWVIPHQGSATAHNRRAFVNRRAESYGILARRLNPVTAGEPWPFPNDPDLIEELCIQQKIFDSDGIRFKLQPKDQPTGARPIMNHRNEVVLTIRQLIGRSPDKADALAYLSWAVFVLLGGLEEGPPESQVIRDDEFTVWAPGDPDFEPVRPHERDEWDAYFKQISKMYDGLETDDESVYSW